MHTLIVIISWLSLLLLLTPLTITNIVITMLLFILGSALILWKKPHKKSFLLSAPLTNPSFYISGFLSAYFALRCYEHLAPSSMVKIIAAKLTIPHNILITVAAVLLSICAVYFIYGTIEQLKNVNSLLRNKPSLQILYCCTLAAIATVAIAQIMINIEILSMGIVNFFLAVTLVLAIVLLLFCLTGKIRLSIFIGTGLFIIISTINACVYSFKGCLFVPADVFAAGTAMEVLDNYSLLSIPFTVVIGLGIWIGLLVEIFNGYKKAKVSLYAKKRVIVALCCIIGAASVIGYTTQLESYHWSKDGAIFNGYYLDFVSKFDEIFASKPKEYSLANIEKISDQYATEASPDKNKADLPHIIVIMDEAFSDLSVLQNIQTNKEITPFISALKDNTISGYALSSVYGGTTANSEYEFLTGNSMAWLSPNVIPYQQYIRSSTYSMVSHLKSEYGYQCIAMHPYLSKGWNRPSAYTHMGFDEQLYIEDFPQKDFIRLYISDREMFDTMIDVYEQKKEDPLFLFGVTMQNHGGYTYSGDKFNKSISLEGYDKEYPDVEQFLSLMHETDKAVERLISYFETVDENVVIVFFGDHQPKLGNTFYTDFNISSSGSLDDSQKYYKVPFFIWANYESDEKFIECTSLNYLSTYVYEVAGLSLPPYNQFLSNLEEKIPAINAHGFYSLESNCFQTFDKASEEERSWLQVYEQLQYNNLVDVKHRNEKLFPPLH